MGGAGGSDQYQVPGLLKTSPFVTGQFAQQYGSCRVLGSRGFKCRGFSCRGFRLPRPQLPRFQTAAVSTGDPQETPGDLQEIPGPQESPRILQGIPCGPLVLVLRTVEGDLVF